MRELMRGAFLLGSRVRSGSTVQNIVREVRGVCGLADDPKAQARLALDFLLYRVLRVLPRLGAGARERTVKLKDGTTITYRLNRGDIQSIREIFLDQAYRLPFDSSTSCLVDLGANIGLTSVWLAKTYGSRCMVAVEPDPTNARLVRKNFRDNGIDATVIEGAVGSTDGTVFFSESRESNLGRVASAGRPVDMVSMATVLGHLRDGQMIDVLKLDIEGGEQDLLTGDLSWLRRVKTIIAEFHPEVVDYPGLVRIVENAGFRYLPADSVFPNSMDAFVASAI